jgi:O-antigen ligase
LLGLATVPAFVTAMMFVIFALASTSRGGMVAFLTSVSLVALLRPLSGRVWRMLAIGGLVVVIFSASGISLDTGQSRELSFEQIVMNLQSVSTDEGTEDLQGTKQWRIDWWDEIIGYTFHGDYFWTGKGFGINLANEDGYQLHADESLRSPHNGHLTVLARSGVPGLFLWLLAQLSWALGMLGGYRRSRFKGERRWASLFLFLLAYWAAFMINAAFDVALEGPMVGIWFWTIYGVGLAAMWIHRCHPEALVGYQRTSPRAQSQSVAQRLPASRR